MKKRSYFVICLVMTLLMNCISVMSVVTVGAAASPFDIDFENSALGTFDYSNESSSIQYWAGNNLNGLTKTIETENGNKYLKIHNFTDLKPFYLIYSLQEDISADKYVKTSFRFRMSEMQQSQDPGNELYFYLNIGNKTNEGKAQSVAVLAITADGKTIVARDNGYPIYQNGERVGNLQPLYTSETSLENQWLTLKSIHDYGSGQATFYIYGENNDILSRFVMKFGPNVQGGSLDNIIPFGSKMTLDIDDISYVGQQTVPADLQTNMNFEDCPVGNFNANFENAATRYWSERNLGNLTKTVTTENGNKYLKVDFNNELKPFYVVSTDSVKNYTADKYAQTSFRFRMKNVQQGADPNEYYFYLNIGNADAAGKIRTDGVLVITADGKRVYPRDVNGCIYSNGQKTNNNQPLYTSETSLHNQWLTMKTVHNYDSGQVTVSLFAESGDLLTNMTLRIGSNIQGGSMGNINPYAKNMTLDIDDITYTGLTAASADVATSIDFENVPLGTFDPNFESAPVRYWAGNNMSAVTKTVKEENGKRYLNCELTDSTKDSAFTWYPINWTTDLSGDRYSESSMRFRIPDLSQRTDVDDAYLYAVITFSKNGAQPIFAISGDGKSIINRDWSNRIYQNGVQQSYLGKLYESESSLSGKWLTLKILNDFETGELTCRLYGEDGSILTKFVQKFEDTMKGLYLNNISFGTYPYCENNQYKLGLDIDEITYQAFTSLPQQEVFDVTVDYNREQGTVSCGGVVFSDKLVAEKGESVTLKITPADAYEIDTITVNNATYTATDNTITLENISEVQAIKVTFKEKIVIPTIAATGADYLIPGNYTKDGQDYPSITAFYKMILPNNADLKEYGMYFGDGTDAVRLSAQGKTMDHVFGIRVFGAAVEKGSTYTFKGFLQMDGEEEVQGIEGSYTITE